MRNKLTFLSHAGFMLETDNLILLMDPWLSKKGAYFGGWYQFPYNHFLESEILDKLEKDKRQKYIYISHLDKDHIDKDFLRKTNNFDIKYFIPEFTKTQGMTQILNNFCNIKNNKIIKFKDLEVFKLDNLQLTFFIQDSARESDSAILVNDGKVKFLNANDCKIHDRLPKISKDCGKIDLLAMQFSGAAWYPVVYKDMLGEENYNKLSNSKVKTRFRVVSKTINTCDIKNYIPSAGPPCFLQQNNFNINFEKFNIFPDTRKFVNYLQKRSKKVNILDLNPGETIYLDEMLINRRDDYKICGLDPYEDKRAYLMAYQDLVGICNVKNVIGQNDKEEIIEKLVRELTEKLTKYKLRNKINRNLYVRVSDNSLKSEIIEVNFKLDKVGRVKSIDKNYYLINLTYEDLNEYFLDSFSNFHDLLLSCRQTMHRYPEDYDYLIDAFLVLDIDEFKTFENRYVDTQKKNSIERICVTHNHNVYEINRWCPHERADLSNAEITDEGNVVCPRHCWAFNLINGGQCEKIKKYTINAIKRK